jgi:threonine/homoserine/homoserine lactone efflux protein
MDLGLYAAFCGAVAVLILIPGPNVALIVSNSVAYGTRYGLLTVLGASAAMVAQLVVVALGMTAVLGVLGQWFEVIRWVGVAYLAFLGVQAWRAAPVDLTTTRAAPKSMRAIVFRGFFVSLSNPKTLVFYGAFFPQFVSAERPVGPQVAVLCVTFLAIAAGLDSGWAVAAGRARRLLAVHGRLRNRITGTLLVGAGVGLAMVRAK